MGPGSTAKKTSRSTQLVEACYRFCGGQFHVNAKKIRARTLSGCNSFRYTLYRQVLGRPQFEAIRYEPAEA
jgi:hypothetical protein